MSITTTSSSVIVEKDMKLAVYQNVANLLIRQEDQPYHINYILFSIYVNKYAKQRLEN